MLSALRQPTRWLTILLVLGGGINSLKLASEFERIWTILSAMALAALLGWAGLAMLGALRQIVEHRNDITVEDNLRARRAFTRIRILHRIGQVTLIFRSEEHTSELQSH